MTQDKATSKTDCAIQKHDNIQTCWCLNSWQQNWSSSWSYRIICDQF